MSVPEAKRLKAEEMKDGLLKKLVADPSLGEQRLQGVIDQRWWCAVNWLRERCEVSMLRACQVMKLPESTCRRRSWRYEVEVLRALNPPGFSGDVFS
jgi:hypothetical protein